MNKLLTRDEFRRQVFVRDNHKCVFCNNPAQDAHHILERRLWSDGGYYIDNGASVCGYHHIECEKTIISVEDVRLACNITKKIIPSHLYDDQIYDKWGNPVLQNGQRLKGELFFDESVQKILNDGGMLNVFTDYVKYPRTHHLPWSEGINDDDRIMNSLDSFKNRRVIVTEKKDGENTSLYNDYFHARSIDSKNHPSRNWCKNFWSTIRSEIPKGWRICGENLYAKHSIEYLNLKSFFYGFSIWNDKNICLSWDETQEWFQLLNITSVPVLYDGIFDENIIKKLYNNSQWNTMEGYVLRTADEILYKDFKNKFGKFVRANHVQTIKHWMHGQPIIQNKLSNQLNEV